MASSSNLNIMQSRVAYKISHNMLPTAVEDARTPRQPRNMGVETSIVPWEASESTPERLEWQPEGWEMKVMTRKNGKTDGVKDRERVVTILLDVQFYYDPVCLHRFRSRKEVEYFIKRGMIRRSTPRSDTSATDGYSAERFDSKNCPTKICWVLNKCSEGLWTPHINNRSSQSQQRDCGSLQWKTLVVMPTNFRGDGEKRYKGGPEVRRKGKIGFCRWCREMEQRRS